MSPMLGQVISQKDRQKLLKAKREIDRRLGKRRRRRKPEPIAKSLTLGPGGIQKGGSDISGFFKISKIDKKQRIVHGIAATDVLDNQDEIVEWEATKRAIPEFVKWGNIREMHQPSAVGTLHDHEIDDAKKQWHVGVKVVDDSAWKKVEEGVYKGFSIGGKAKSRIKEFSSKVGKMISKVKDYVLTEISLVDRPANPECVFTVLKRDFNTATDPLYYDVDQLERIAKSLKRKIMTDDEIMELPDKVFGLIRKRRTEEGIVKERLLAMPSPAHARAVLKALPFYNDLRPNEKEVVHKRAARTLGKRHTLDSCPMCRAKVVDVMRKGGENRSMSRTDLQEASALLQKILHTDYEMPPGNPEEGVHGEQHTSALRKPDNDPKLSSFEGSKYPDVEGPDEELDYEDEDFDAGSEEGYPDSDFQEGFDEGLDADEYDTHLYDSEAVRADKEDIEGPELDEEDFEDEDFDVEEDAEVGDPCPYCGVTLKMLASGNIAKGEAQCPACGTLHKVDTNFVRQYSRTPNRRDRIQKRGRRRPVAKADEVAEAQTEVIFDSLETVGEVLPNVLERLEKLERVPGPRQIAKKVEKGGEENLQEDMAKLDELKEKAIALKKMERDTGKPMGTENQMFVDKVLEAALASKFQK